MGIEGHDAFAIPSRVVLARENPFRLGRLQIEPAIRQVSSGEQRQTLEPRVMQVLIALARADGDVVARDDLIEWCWGGRIVSDDAINRVLSRIRHLARGLGGGSFAVETIPRVGYRLSSTGERAPQLNAHSTPAIDRRTALAVTAAAAAAAAAGSILLIRERQDPIPPEARQLYDRAEAMASASTPVASELVVPYLQEAVRIAPQFGDAWGLLALAYRAQLLDAPAQRVELEPRIREAVANARRFSPGNADAAAATLVREWHYGKWGRVEPVYRTLIERHPDYAFGHHMLGQFMMDVGRWRDSIDWMRSARALEPLAPVLSYKLVVALWGAGRISEAEDEIASATRRWPRHGAIWQTRTKLLILTGRPGEALTLLNDESGHPPDEDGGFSDKMRLVATALLTAAPADKSAAIASIASDEPVVAGAIYAAALGDVRLSLDMLEGIYLRRGRLVPSHRYGQDATHPLFQPHAKALWAEPRFGNLLEAIGLESYWRDAGSGPDYRRIA